MFILDTNVICELRHGKPNQSPAVRAWAAVQPASRLFLSAITLLELEMGVQSLERIIPAQGSAMRAWLRAVRLAFAGRILPFSDSTATVCASLPGPVPGFGRDAMIAATAIEHRFTVVTPNTGDFVATGVALTNPWMD